MNTTREQLGPYKLLRAVGRGGMSVVYEGFDTRFERRVAIKVVHISPHLAFEDQTTTIARLKREARVIARLSHPNIVSIYDVGEEDGLHYLVMEFVEGITLRQRLDESGPLSYQDAAKILDQIASALDTVHAAGIVHRDLKPSNVMLIAEADLRIKLMDFGVARLSDEASLTQNGFLVGTPTYLSPEQVTGEEVGPASDLWSLGVLLYEMLSGQTPFASNAMHTTLLNIVQESPTPINGVPEQIQDVINFALDKHPRHRFSSALALSKAYQYALRTTGLSESERKVEASPVITPPISVITPEPEVIAPPPDESPDVPEWSVADTIELPRTKTASAVTAPTMASSRPRSAAVFPRMAVVALVVLGLIALVSAAVFRSRPASQASTSVPAEVVTAPSVKSVPASPRPTVNQPAKKTPVRQPAQQKFPVRTAKRPQGRIVESTPPTSPAPKPTPRPVGKIVVPFRPTAPPVRVVVGLKNTPTPLPGLIVAAEPPPTPAAEPPPTPTAGEVLPSVPEDQRADEGEPIKEEEELAQLLGAWIAATNAKDTEAQMAFYPRLLERYYTLRDVTRGQVRADKERLIGKAKKVDILVGEPSISYDTDGETAVLRFRKDYDIEGGPGARQGAVVQELRLRRDAGGYWKIVSERDLQVLSRR